MYLCEQLINPTDARLRLSAQLGVEGIVIDTRPNLAIMGNDGCWEARKVGAQRKWIEGFGLRLEVLALDIGSFLLDSLRAPERAAITADRLRRNIRAAADGGVSTLKYTVAMVGITRTGEVQGRGGVRCSAFCAAQYDPGRVARFSYWGTELPEESGVARAPGVGGQTPPQVCGQVPASETGGISEEEGWNCLTALVEAIIPTAEKAGVRLAAHPHDPAYPPGGLNGVHHVLGSVQGMRRFLDLAPGVDIHGFNFCQGTIAEMAPDPSPCVLNAIREFGRLKRIFMVHFRNIKGGYLNFSEAFPDEGVVNMAACIQAYREIGYDGPLCPDHTPFSDLDPERERFFAFCLGYTRGLLHGIVRT